jgi:hypothetical protein
MTIDLVIAGTTYTAADFGATIVGHSGLGVAPIINHALPIEAGDGAVYLGTHVGERVVTLSLMFGSVGNQEPYEVQDSISALLDLFYNQEVLLRRSDRELVARYAGGGEGDQVGGQPWEQQDLRFVVHSPFWRALNDSSQTDTIGAGLSSYDIEIDYTGSAEAWPVFVIETDAATDWDGPEPLTFESGFSLAAGERLTINCEPTAKTISSTVRANLYSLLDGSATPQHVRLLPGRNVFRVYPNSTAATVTTTWRTQYWSID